MVKLNHLQCSKMESEFLAQLIFFGCWNWFVMSNLLHCPMIVIFVSLNDFNTQSSMAEQTSLDYWVMSRSGFTVVHKMPQSLGMKNFKHRTKTPKWETCLLNLPQCMIARQKPTCCPDGRIFFAGIKDYNIVNMHHIPVWHKAVRKCSWGKIYWSWDSEGSNEREGYIYFSTFCS